MIRSPVWAVALINRVDQGFWAYGIQGCYKLGIRYIYAEIWVLSISFLLRTSKLDITYCDGTALNVFGTNRISQQASTEAQLLYSDLDCLR